MNNLVCENARPAGIKRQDRLLRAGKYIFRREGLTLQWLVRPGAWEVFAEFKTLVDLEKKVEHILGFDCCLEATI